VVQYLKITKPYPKPNSVKGLVHPKMKIKSLITHPYVVPTS